MHQGLFVVIYQLPNTIALEQLFCQESFKIGLKNWVFFSIN
jgi:hypothetical protein